MPRRMLCGACRSRFTPIGEFYHATESLFGRANVVFSGGLTWRGPCASTGRDKADRQLQNFVICPAAMLLSPEPNPIVLHDPQRFVEGMVDHHPQHATDRGANIRHILVLQT